jgi:serine/threonine protein kinase
MVSRHCHGLHLSPSDCHPMLTNISTVNGRYNICQCIGSGSFGMMSLVSKILQVSLSSLNVSRKIFAGYDIISGEDVAIKFEPQSSKYLHLKNKYIIYKSIGNHISIPRLKWFGQEHNQRVLVLSLLGPSLEDIFVGSGCRFKLRTVLAIANQMVCFVCLFVFYTVWLFSECSN